MPPKEPKTTDPVAWFLNLIGLRSIESSLESLHKKVDKLMSAYTDARDEWVVYTQGLQSENAELRSALTDAQTTAQANADALAAFQADDAATDASQLAAQEQAFADDLKSTLDGLKPPPPEPEPLPEPPVEPEPVDPNAPHPDQTLPGDLQ